jgi:competence protein ComEA
VFEIISRLRSSPEDAERARARLAALRPPPIAPSRSSGYGGAGWLPDDRVFAGLDARSAQGRPAVAPAADPPIEPAPIPPVPARASSRTSALRRWIGGLLPASVSGVRVDPGRRGASALLVVAVGAAVLVGVLTWRSRPVPVPVEPPALASPSGAPGAMPSAAEPVLVVAVTGKVRRPGVVSLPAGSRVVDAVRAAGGALPGADISRLNLARRLVDGELVAVGIAVTADSAGPPADAGAAGPASAAAAAPLNLNTATAEQLDTLPGVGPVLAQRILEWRAAHGRFDTVDQLRQVDGIGDSKFAQLRDRVTV